MGYPVAAGRPDYSGIFIPEYWSGKFNIKFYKYTVLAQIANTNWEGEIKKDGDTVHIRQIPTVQNYAYTKGQTLGVDTLTEPLVDLVVDQGRYFSFLIDDVDKYQMDQDLMDKWSDAAAKDMKVTIDRLVLSGTYGGASADNVGSSAGVESSSYNMGVAGTPIALNEDNVVDYLVDAGSVLDEQNIPDEDRWCVLPVWLCNKIKKSDLKDASLSGDAKSMLRTGLIGEIDRFKIYRSNSVPTTTDTVTTYYCMCGHISALTFAAQMTEMRSLVAESTFGTKVQGLNVYGYKVVKPEALTYIYAKNSA